MTKSRELVQIYLNNGFAKEEADAEIDFAIEIISGLSKKDLILGIMPSIDDISKLRETVERRVKTREPIAQILGQTFFMRERFFVTKDTLIPRPETELLVNKAVEIIKEHDFSKVLDIGTGSGCIACMIAKQTTAQVLGVDISNGALKTALNNSMRMTLENKALFRKSDLFSNVSEMFDMIVSNPPYIPVSQKDSLQIEVRDYEPETALFAGDEEGIEFYKKIIKNAPAYINKGGYLLFETGINQAFLIENLLIEHGFSDIKVYRDVSEVERVIISRLFL
jgi:release factor glutamine methyltransferase